MTSNALDLQSAWSRIMVVGPRFIEGPALAAAMGPTTMGPLPSISTQNVNLAPFTNP